MFNGCDIYWVIDGQERMSETINNAIRFLLGEGSIEELPLEQVPGVP